jgi:hypothetical protein
MANELPQPGNQAGATPANQPPGTQQQNPSQPTPRPQQTPFKRLPANQYGVSVKPLGKGTLLVAKYDYFKHDPYPLILVSSLYSDQRLAGINLHYLTFKYVKSLVKNYCNNVGFGYQSIKGDKYIVNAFRTYKRSGLKQGKLIDGDFLLNVLGTARSYSPNEIEKIRQHIQQQLRQQINPRSDQMTNRHTNQLIDALKQQQSNKDTMADGRRNPNLPTPGQSASIPGTPASQSPTGGN